MDELRKQKILGVGITAENRQKVLEYLERGLKKGTKSPEGVPSAWYVTTPNPELLVLANNNSSFKKILNEAKIALPDGVGVLFAGWLLGRPFPQKITGVDFVDFVCKRVADLPITTGFLGGRPGVAEATADCLKKKYPGLKVVLAQEELKNPGSMVNCDILFVAFGSPKQEIWINDNLKVFPVKIAVGVGGAFDMISGKVPRAPRLIRNLGLEWLFRLVIQPWRIKRQLKLIVFVSLVAKEWFKKRFIA